MRPTTNPTPPVAPWRITEVIDHGAKQWYRYSVRGENLNFVPPEPISWAVPSLDDPQYDLSGATFVSADERDAFRIVEARLDDGSTFALRCQTSFAFARAVEEARRLRAYSPGTLRSRVLRSGCL